jgi:hypothetical protein
MLSTLLCGVLLGHRVTVGALLKRRTDATTRGGGEDGRVQVEGEAGRLNRYPLPHRLFAVDEGVMEAAPGVEQCGTIDAFITLRGGAPHTNRVPIEGIGRRLPTATG